MATGASSEMSGRDAVEVLMTDHRTVDALFSQFESLSGAGDESPKGELAQRIVKELSIHAAIEEKVFYPAVREALSEGDTLVEESLDEHQQVKELLADLDKMQPGDEGFDQKVLDVIDNVRHHVEEEENDILPKLQEAIPRERLVQIGEALEKAKGMAPTHPHPHAPNEPPGNLVAGPAAAVVDRVRDLGNDQDQ